jgi:PQQ-dependent dehydrogenase (methanol/ethanol family)
MGRRRKEAVRHTLAALGVSLSPLLPLFLAGACQKHVEVEHTPESAGLAGASKATTTSATASAAEDGQWTMPAKDYANTRYARLDQITTANVKDLRLVWRYPTGVVRGHEAAPLVAGGMMYVVTPFPNRLLAFDLTTPGAPPKWTYDPGTDERSQGVACCDVVNRGAFLWHGRVYFNTLDDHTVAVDAATGQELWKVELGEIARGETMTMAPIVVKGKVIVGNSGGELGVRGWLTALDADTGAIAWRAYSTGPDSEVLIGPEFAPFYAAEKGKDLGVASWPAGQWKIGGGAPWGFVSYDPELDLLYYGTSNPGPWNAELRPGDNKWTSSVFARRPEDGHARWAYQYNPHDLHDYDGINEHVLMDLVIAGQPRKVLLHADRNGYMYEMDRATGEVLAATPYVFTNTVAGVDLKSGLPKTVAALGPKTNQVTRDICPASPGGKDWQPMSFSPKTGLAYVPHQNLCQDEEGTEVSYIAGTPYVGANVRMKAGPGGTRGELCAWDPVKAEKRWAIPERFPVWSGTVVTSGDVVFYGTMDGWFKAVSAIDGRQLWKFKTQSGVISQPVTYRGPDGKQYVAVLDGVGGWAGVVVAGDLDTSDPSAALGFAGAMADLKEATKKGGAVYVFALP